MFFLLIGVPTDLPEKVIIFRYPRGVLTDLPEKLIIFRYPWEPQLTFMKSDCFLLSTGIPTDLPEKVIFFSPTGVPSVLLNVKICRFSQASSGLI